MTSTDDETRYDGESMPTGDLARRAHGDDVDAFNLLYARVAPALLAWAEIRLHTRLKRVIDPEDVVQEVWSRAMDRYRDDDTPDPDKFRPWVFGVAHFVVMEALRKSRAQVAGTVELIIACFG